MDVPAGERGREAGDRVGDRVVEIRREEPRLVALDVTEAGAAAGGTHDLRDEPAAHELARRHAARRAVAERQRTDRVVGVRRVEARHRGVEHAPARRVRVALVGVHRHRRGQDEGRRWPARREDQGSRPAPRDRSGGEGRIRRSARLVAATTATLARGWRSRRAPPAERRETCRHARRRRCRASVRSTRSRRGRGRRSRRRRRRRVRGRASAMRACVVPTQGSPRRPASPPRNGSWRPESRATSATATRAISVFPQPGGPTSRIVRRPSRP